MVIETILDTGIKFFLDIGCIAVKTVGISERAAERRPEYEIVLFQTGNMRILEFDLVDKTSLEKVNFRPYVGNAFDKCGLDNIGFEENIQSWNPIVDGQSVRLSPILYGGTYLRGNHCGND
jgi:hypothetical protein